MRRILGIAALALVASAAKAQDTTVVVVRHLTPQQDSGVVVRHLAPPPQRPASPYGARRYATRGSAIFAKDPNFGSFLSFVFPGGGQYYADQPGKGLAITALAIGAPIIGYANVTRDRIYYNGGPLSSDYHCGPSYPTPMGSGGVYCHRYDWTPAAIGLGVGITAWLYGVATAGTDVQHWNQAHGVRFVTAPGRVGFAVAVP